MFKLSEKGLLCEQGTFFRCVRLRAFVCVNSIKT